MSSRIISEGGYVVHVKSAASEAFGTACIVPPQAFPSEKWIAIIEKSIKEGCKLAKLLASPSLRNASAVVIYPVEDISETEVQGKKNKGLCISHCVLFEQESFLDNMIR